MSAIVCKPYSALKTLFNTSKLYVIKCRAIVKDNLRIYIILQIQNVQLQNCISITCIAMLPWQPYATTRNYTRDSTRKHFKYGGDDISSRISENLSCFIHIFCIIYIMTSGNISSNHPRSGYINDKNHVRLRNFPHSNKRWMLWYLNEI